MLRVQQTRRSTADVDRIHHGVRKLARQADTCRLIKLTMPPDLLANRPYIRREPRRGHHSGMEVTVRALRLTKRHLYVDSEVGAHLQNSSTLRRLPMRGGTSRTQHGSCSARL